MSETRENLKTLIRESQEAIDKARRKLEELETTYSAGDRFTEGAKDEKYILAVVSESPTKAVFVSLEDGRYWEEARRIKNCYSITQKEFDEICDGGEFSRYWDSQRKELTK